MTYKHLLIIGFITVLLTTGCDSQDPLILAEANKRNAEAERTRTETQIKQEDWQLRHAREQWDFEKQKAKDDLQRRLDEIYAPIEREENIKRQWTAFWLGACIFTGLVLLGAGIAVDRYRLARRTMVRAIEDEIRQLRLQRDDVANEVQRLQNEAANYRAQARAELTQIRKEQREARKQVAEEHSRLLELREQCRVEEERLKQLGALNAQLYRTIFGPAVAHPNNGDVDLAALPTAK